MNKKILFWIDANLTHFGIAKYIKQQYAAELFAIYDFNIHLKKSFQNQHIVNFKKEWFYWDHHLDKNYTNPDLEYLKSFETKYGINLWEIIFSERLFYKYNDFYKFQKNELLSILEYDCKFFEDILEQVKPDFLFIGSAEFHKSNLLAELCKKKGIRVLRLFPSKLGRRAMISSEFDVIDDLDISFTPKNLKTLPELRDFLLKYNKYEYSKKRKSGGEGYSFLYKTKILLHWLFFTFNNEYRKTYDHNGITRLKLIKYQITMSIKKFYRQRFINKISLKDFVNSKKNAIFFLQVEPERNVSIATPFFSNQIEVISNIAKSLPIDFILYVKEHPAMKRRGYRAISYYKKINSMPNVKLIDISIKPEHIFTNCSIVFTMTGSAGMEAAFYGKPAIIFSDPVYSNFSWAKRIKSFEELPSSITHALETKIDIVELNRFVYVLEKNSFEFDDISLTQEIFDNFYHGFLVGDKVSMVDLDLFIKNKEKQYKLVAMEYIKKINSSIN